MDRGTGGAVTPEVDGRSGRRAEAPAFGVAYLLSLCLGAILLFQIGQGRDLYFVRKATIPGASGRVWGVDYFDFYQAASVLARGGNPYDVPRYVVPPLPALFNRPLARLPFERARVLVAAASLAALLASYLLAVRTFVPGPALLHSLLALLVVLLSYPACFLLERGNIDAFVLLLLCAAIAMLVARPRLAGVALGLAIGAKLYPALLLLPLLVLRKHKAVVWAALTLAASVAVAPSLWADFLLHRLPERAGRFHYELNASLAGTLAWAGLAVGASDLLRALAHVVYLLALGLMLWLDARAPAGAPLHVETRLMLYLPMMVAVPQVSYQYGLVLLLPLLPLAGRLWARAGRSAEAVPVAVIALGIALSQLHVVALERLTGAVVFQALPGAGLLVVMLGTLWWRLGPGGSGQPL